jgi:hypothetical protein
MLGALAWDYVDGVIYQASQMDIPTKKTSRQLRNLQRVYERDRSYHGIDNQIRQDEINISLNFEAVCKKIIAKTHKEVLVALHEDLNNRTDRGRLLIALNDALMVLQVMCDYADRCDAYIESCCRFKPDHSILYDHFRIMRSLLTKYAQADLAATRAVRLKGANGLMRELRLTELIKVEE